MKKRIWGFTLVELLMVMAVLAVVATIAVGTFNSVGIYNRARDARRKKDIGRIKVAFEEYYNDKGCYPSKGIVSTLMSKSNCGSNIFSPWLSSWPCDPNGSPYQIAVESFLVGDGCPKWYKVLTELENKSDSGIPDNWNEVFTSLGGGYGSDTANFGVSSSNVDWSDERADPECIAYGGCYYHPNPSSCDAISACVGPNCFLGVCKNTCRISCCGVGCN